MHSKLNIQSKQLYKIFLLIVGSILGAILRWKLNNYFWVNISGAALLGLIVGLRAGSRIQFFLVIGFCGSFTTFSGWILDVFDLFRTGFFWKAAGLICSNLLGGFTALSVTFWIGRKIRHLFIPQ
ncbi:MULTISPECIES: fluoride efflux transporter FluC [Prochlorococcus]|uniref:Fluoride-specific ion channel FluC 1 n=1 Tax=Prochlorococcus marinus (strain SARG / CCMP1375 / SS120) TaxID=167539 RepID=FLUC1_PROMA|nr:MULTISPECIES: CrcB family protein [Prochlorococcus]Q7V9N6.1 RecName: Full=Fluoride-specific ion channel FluC 1 [Prochlorococcus marinus subsp. marinus str. CCMP1375]AAQ00837.1 Conserved membrane protein [Prochlorococcus marinus subsp. marinus str. CCMP1375]KGG10668.1 hypothetical protein EV04_1628 [Prochlorococcus marinus str. LG]KGG21089.1 hypothetical protein EV08_0805 [Prochlorococcus marinus str. SS2]KGG23915.1 hypothetical protein EV09_0518 [Prochlorococcus marinus str. SS35]KGG31826.